MANGPKHKVCPCGSARPAPVLPLPPPEPETWACKAMVLKCSVCAEWGCVDEEELLAHDAEYHPK